MPLLADEQHHRLLHSAVGESPHGVRSEIGDGRGELLAQRRALEVRTEGDQAFLTTEEFLAAAWESAADTDQAPLDVAQAQAQLRQATEAATAELARVRAEAAALKDASAEAARRARTAAAAATLSSALTTGQPGATGGRVRRSSAQRCAASWAGSAPRRGSRP